MFTVPFKKQKNSVLHTITGQMGLTTERKIINAPQICYHSCRCMYLDADGSVFTRTLTTHLYLVPRLQMHEVLFPCLLHNGQWGVIYRENFTFMPYNTHSNLHKYARRNKHMNCCKFLSYFISIRYKMLFSTPLSNVCNFPHCLQFTNSYP